jgi:hypothetical protein
MSIVFTDVELRSAVQDQRFSSQLSVMNISGDVLAHAKLPDDIWELKGSIYHNVYEIKMGVHEYGRAVLCLLVTSKSIARARLGCPFDVNKDDSVIFIPGSLTVAVSLGVI